MNLILTILRKKIHMEIKQIKYISMRKNIIKRILLNILLRKFPYQKSWIKGVKYDKANPAYKKYMKHGTEDYLHSNSLTRPNGANGVIGCWIAHSHAIENITDIDGITVVLEDDFACKASFFKAALDMIEKFDRDFDVIVFDPRGDAPPPSYFIKPNICETKETCIPYFIGAQCLFINNKSIEKILNIKLNSKVKDVDGFLFANPNINTYAFYTGLSHAQWFGSDTMGINSFQILKRGIKDWWKYVA